MLACAYFNKDVPRLVAQKNRKEWNRFFVGELRGKTMGTCVCVCVCVMRLVDVLVCTHVCFESCGRIGVP